MKEWGKECDFRGQIFIFQMFFQLIFGAESTRETIALGRWSYMYSFAADRACTPLSVFLSASRCVSSSQTTFFTRYHASMSVCPPAACARGTKRHARLLAR